MPVNMPLLGFNVLVAPLNKALAPQGPTIFNSTFSGDVSQLSRAVHATSQMAPNISDIIREILQGQQITDEAQKSYLDSINSLSRYNFAFKRFWGFCKLKNLPINQASMAQVASNLQLMNNYFPTDCKNVYAALLKIPGFDQLRFHPLLNNCKKQWQKSIPKYATFWSPEPVIQKLLREPLDFKNVSQVRDRLILSLRFFMLFRNIDLHRTYRTVSLVNGKPFISVQRKNWSQPQLEEVVRLPSTPTLCPWTLLQHYVALTRSSCVSGSHLFRQLCMPFSPVSANTLGSITKKMSYKIGS